MRVVHIVRELDGQSLVEFYKPCPHGNGDDFRCTGDYDTEEEAIEDAIANELDGAIILKKVCI